MLEKAQCILEHAQIVSIFSVLVSKKLITNDNECQQS